MKNSRPARLGIAGLLAVTLIGTAACSSQQSGPAASEALEVWSRSGPEAARTYQAVFDKFTEKTGIKVEYLATVEFETQLRARAAAKDLPDVMIYDQASMAAYAADGLLLPVVPAEIAGNDQLSTESWDSVKLADGSYHGVPFSQHASITFIRKDWREKLKKKVPTTHEELLELAQAFAKDDPDGNGKNDTYGMAVPGTTDRGFFTWWASPYLWQRGGDIVTGSAGKYTPAVDTAKSEAAFNWVKKLFCTPGMVQPGALSNASATPFFAEGKAGIYQTGPYAFPNFDKAPGKDKYEVIMAPKGPNGQTTLTERTSIYFGATSKAQEQQKKLAEFLISAEGQELGMTAPGQPVVRLPVNTGVDAVKVYDDKRWGLVEDQLKDSRLLPSDIDFTAIRQDVAETMAAMFAKCDADIAPDLAQLSGRIKEDLSAKGALA